MSTLVVDTLTGKSTATTITIGSTPVVSASANSLTIRGEGSAQTSVQQGLAKSWWEVDGTGDAHINDSLNTSGFTDHGTGDYTVTYSNNMGNATYSAVGSCGRNGGSYVGGDCEIPGDGATTTSAIRFFSYNSSAGLGDVVYISGQICGDLA